MARRKLTNHWKYIEMYENTSVDFPKPLIFQSENNFLLIQILQAIEIFSTSKNEGKI